jgi:Gas vesicle synthesis protein GvpO
MAERDRADAGDADRRDADQGDGDRDTADGSGADGSSAARSGAARSGKRRRSARTAEITAAQAARLGMEQIAELTGKDPESVTGVEPAEDGWLVTVEVIEDHRIPSSTDILATYETDLTPDGDLISYRRQRRYARGHGDMARG